MGAYHYTVVLPNDLLATFLSSLAIILIHGRVAIIWNLLSRVISNRLLLLGHILVLLMHGRAVLLRSHL